MNGAPLGGLCQAWLARALPDGVPHQPAHDIIVAFALQPRMVDRVGNLVVDRDLPASIRPLNSIGPRHYWRSRLVEDQAVGFLAQDQHAHQVTTLFKHSDQELLVTSEKSSRYR